MAGSIRILDDTVANRIAAGEVVERPASVVRELVDNAIDAGSDTIHIEIRKGGKSLISVSDNGMGMSQDDALLSLERHATSKLSSAEDLFSIETLGFRGEALSSISSVGKFKLATREPQSISGTEVISDGGKIREVREVGCPVGTHIELRSLFFHTPARRKFLKADLTEQTHIDSAVKSAAFCYPSVTFHYRHESGEKNYLAVEDWSERIAQIQGKPWMRETRTLEVERAGMKLWGRIGNPGVGRRNRQESLLYVNGRQIVHRGIQFAIVEGYRQSLIKGRYPIHILFLEVPPSEVDVNIHPAKREVKFRDEAMVRRFIAESVQSALEEKQPIPPQDQSDNPNVSFLGPRVEHAVYRSAPKLPLVEKREPHATSDQERQDLSPSEQETQERHDLSVHGTFLDTYIIASNQQGAVMVDVKASYERILFEEALRQLAIESAVSQQLLVPVTIEMDADAVDWVRKNESKFEKLGLGLSGLGGNTFIVDALPPRISGTEVDTFIQDLVQSLMDSSSYQKASRLADEKMAAAYARQAARRLPFPNEKEIARLLDDLHQCDLPYTNAAGKPTMILFSKEELARRFAKS